MYRVKWNETKAYYHEGSDGVICVNLKGREPYGVVSKEEYSKVVSYITSKLKEVEDPETGEKIVERVYTKEELFGTSDITLPDIFILLRDGYRAVGYNKIDGSLFMPPIHGRVFRPADHHVNGVFIAYGHGIANKALKGKVKTWDIAPTILYIFRLPVLGLDGRVLEDVLKEELKLSEEPYYLHKDSEREKIKEKIRELKRIKKIK